MPNSLAQKGSSHILPAPYLPQQPGVHLCVQSLQWDTEPPLPWHIFPGTLGVSWDRICMFKAGSCIYIAPWSKLLETKCLVAKNWTSSLFYFTFLVFLFLFIISHSLLLQSTGDEYHIGVNSKNQTLAVFAIRLSRTKHRLRSGGPCAKTLMLVARHKPWSRRMADFPPCLRWLGQVGCHSQGKEHFRIQVKESWSENCFPNESAEPSPKALEPARGKSR